VREYIDFRLFFPIAVFETCSIGANSSNQSIGMYVPINAWGVADFSTLENSGGRKEHKPFVRNKKKTLKKIIL
jgi:hypothetical protein